MLYCENCHAPIPEESAKCPYCGAFNALGGERQYMEQLYDLKEDVEEISEVPEQEYRREMGKIGRILFRRFLCLQVWRQSAASGFICFSDPRIMKFPRRR